MAAVDFSSDTVTALVGVEGDDRGIVKGYASGNLSFTANLWGGAANPGEFGVSGTQFTPNAEETKYYALNGQRVAMARNDVVFYLHGDHLGSASLTTDASGAVVSEMRYFPYGETRSGAVPTDWRYTGQREETGLGLYDYGARRYDPALGRFIQADTIVPEPGNPQSLNRYAYALNNVLRYTDPSGHFSEEEIMQYLGVNEWAEVLAYFEAGGQLEGWWGWLAVLRQAELGWTVSMWSDGSEILQHSADANMTFMEREGKLWLCADSPGGHIEMGVLGAARLVGMGGVYSVDGHYFGAGGKVLHPTYDPSLVDWTGIAVDGAGIVADLLTLGVGGKLLNAAQVRSVGGVLGKAFDAGGLLWDWGPTAVNAATEGFTLDADTLGLCLDVAGMVSPVPIWADSASIIVGLTEGYWQEP